MKYLLWFLRVLLFLVLLGFAIKNTDPVAVRFYLGGAWEAPLVFVLLVAFVVGCSFLSLPEMEMPYHFVGLSMALKNIALDDAESEGEPHLAAELAGTERAA